MSSDAFLTKSISGVISEVKNVTQTLLRQGHGKKYEEYYVEELHISIRADGVKAKVTHRFINNDNKEQKVDAQAVINVTDVDWTFLPKGDQSCSIAAFDSSNMALRTVLEQHQIEDYPMAPFSGSGHAVRWNYSCDFPKELRFNQPYTILYNRVMEANDYRLSERSLSIKNNVDLKSKDSVQISFLSKQTHEEMSISFKNLPAFYERKGDIDIIYTCKPDIHVKVSCMGGAKGDGLDMRYLTFESINEASDGAFDGLRSLEGVAMPVWEICQVDTPAL